MPDQARPSATSLIVKSNSLRATKSTAGASTRLWSDWTATFAPISPTFRLGLAAFIASKTGKAEDFFLPGLLLNAAYAVGYLVSIAIRWPLLGVILGPLGGVVPALFTGDPVVRERAQEIWWIFAATMLANGAVFALDGILIGAGDTRFIMWAMLSAAAVYVPVALLALHFGWGIRGVWLGLAGLIAVRLVTCVGRFLSGRWAVVGAA